MNAAMIRAFAALEAHRAAIAATPLGQRFADDPERFAKFSTGFDDFLLDYSKNLIDDEVMARLLALAEAAEVEKRRDAMFAGEPINVTENRPVLHVALRAARRRGLSRRRRERRADGARGARPHGGLRRGRALRRHRRAKAASSPTWSISASAAPISDRRWRRWRWRPSMTGRGSISSPMSMAPTCATRWRNSIRRRRCSWSPRRPSPPSRP